MNAKGLFARLFVCLCLSAPSCARAQGHSSQAFDYETALKDLRQTAFKGSPDRPDTNQLEALYQIANIYLIRYKSVKDKKNSAYLDSSYHYLQLLIDGSHRTGQLDYEAAGNLVWGLDEMAAETDYKLIVQRFLAAASLCEDYIRIHGTPDEIILDTHSDAYSNIGYIYFLNKEYDNSLRYCDLAIQHAWPIYNRAKPLIYKGRVYMAEKNYPAAGANLHQAISALENNPINMRWEAMDYLAELLIETDRPDSALSVLRQAITGDKRAYHLDMHDYWMGQAFLRKRNLSGSDRLAVALTDSVLAYGRQELILGERLAKSQDRLWAYELLYKGYEPSADKAAELTWYQQWVTLSDSLNAIERGKDIAEIQHKYDYQKVQAESERRTGYFLVTCLGLLFLIAALLAFYGIKMRRKNQQLNRKNKEILDARFKGQHFERKRVAAELHDHLSSLLAATKLSMQVLDPSALSAGEQKIFQSVLDMMDTACKEVRYISHNMMPVNIEREGLSAALTTLIGKLNQPGFIVFELTPPDPLLVLDKMTTFNLYSICLELCNNILRHSKATRANIIFKSYQKEIHLLVTDNGKGIADIKKDGIGIKNVNERIESLNGTLEVHTSAEGTSFWFTIPLEPRNVPEHT